MRRNGQNTERYKVVIMTKPAGKFSNTQKTRLKDEISEYMGVPMIN